MSSRPVVIAPDPFRAVIPHLREVLNGVEVGVTMPTGPVDRYVWVRRVSTGSDAFVIDRPSLDFTVFGSDFSERVELANLVRGHVLAMDGTYSGVRVFGATEVQGPTELPDPNVDDRTVTLMTIQISTRSSAL